MTQKKHSIPQTKIRAVKEIVDLMKTKSTILIASIKNLPASQFQQIGKKLRGKAVVKVPKKNLFTRAIDEIKDNEIELIKDKFEDSSAILISDLDVYDLASELIKNKSPAKAKPGQIAINDISVEPGPTDLVPGPAISELGGVGIQIQIQAGKIHIKDHKILVKAGEKISQAVADVLSKLDIKPFSIGYIPLCGMDIKNKKLYTNININREEAIENLKTAFSKALPFAVEINYASKETIGYLLAKASRHATAIEKLSQTPEIKTENSSVNAEESTEIKGEEN
jgi:large subunit ribosomal protein L10